ncbi:MAG: AraC family transcriptional regulator [Saccharofermentans sp.]|nr:AraC family transcriptional regulator [Saccharofermentans sp.]
MELFTKNHDPSWDRIVHIRVHEKNGISEYINDRTLYKVLVISEGAVTLSENDAQRIVSAPALVLLSGKEVQVSGSEGVKTTTVYFRPTEIREEFTIDRVESGEFDAEEGKTIYQDYLLVHSFGCMILPLSLSSHDRLLSTIEMMNTNLTDQYDGYWPCRSRSFLMELLYFIRYVCTSYSYEKTRNTVVTDNSVSDIIQYLNEHISEKITLDDIMRKFSINRNKLNELFIKETSTTCLNYLTKMRINLAQVILAETELQIAEISYRVGFTDPNYFIKVFKKYTGVTPSGYRKSFN